MSYPIRIVFSIAAGGETALRVACYFDGPDPLPQRVLDDFAVARTTNRSMPDEPDAVPGESAKDKAWQAACCAVFDGSCRKMAMLGEGDVETDVALANVTRRMKAAIALEIVTGIEVKVNQHGQPS